MGLILGHLSRSPKGSRERPFLLCGAAAKLKAQGPPMPLIQKLTCPHCLTSDAGFRMVHEIFHPSPATGAAQGFTIIAECPACFEVVATSIKLKQAGSANSFIQNKRGNFEDHVHQVAVIAKMYPNAASVEAPEHTSSGVQRCFRQACDNAVRGNRDAAGEHVP